MGKNAFLITKDANVNANSISSINSCAIVLEGQETRLATTVQNQRTSTAHIPIHQSENTADNVAGKNRELHLSGRDLKQGFPHSCFVVPFFAPPPSYTCCRNAILVSHTKGYITLFSRRALCAIE